MRTLSKLTMIFFAVALTVTFGQGPHAGAGQGQGNGNRAHNATQNGQPQLDLSQVYTLNGPVTAVNIGLGTQLPSVEVAGTTVRLGPAWYILESGLEIQVGDAVNADVAPPLNADGYVYAVRIENTTRGGTLEFRLETGIPAWARKGGQGRGGPNGATAGNGAGRVNNACGFTATGAVTGTVESVTMGIGLGQPNVVMNVPQADAVSAMTIKLGPFRILQELGVTIAPNDVLTVDYGVSACTEENVAVVLSIGGEQFVLRNPDGAPAW